MSAPMYLESLIQLRNAENLIATAIYNHICQCSDMKKGFQWKVRDGFTDCIEAALTLGGFETVVLDEDETLLIKLAPIKEQENKE